jgi:hypothetical protein
MQLPVTTPHAIVTGMWSIAMVASSPIPLMFAPAIHIYTSCVTTL